MQKHHLAELICEYGNKYQKNPDLLFVSQNDYLSLEQFAIQNHSPLASDPGYQGVKAFFGATVFVVDDPHFKAECFMVEDIEYAIKTGFTRIKKYRLAEPLKGYVNKDLKLDVEGDYIEVKVPDLVKNTYLKKIGSR